MTVPHETVRWRKSSWSTASDTCVELAYVGAVRDSKNPTGPMLTAAIPMLVAALKAGTLDR